MALETADVIKLQCVLYGVYTQKVEASNYGINCNTKLLDDTITQGEFLLDLYNLSPTVCKQLECNILAFNENKTLYCLECTEPCTREVITQNIDNGLPS